MKKITKIKLIKKVTIILIKLFKKILEINTEKKLVELKKRNESKFNNNLRYK
jgi:hypothetical protein